MPVLDTKIIYKINSHNAFCPGDCLIPIMLKVSLCFHLLLSALPTSLQHKCHLKCFQHHLLDHAKVNYNNLSSFWILHTSPALIMLTSAIWHILKYSLNFQFRENDYFLVKMKRSEVSWIYLLFLLFYSHPCFSHAYNLTTMSGASVAQLRHMILNNKTYIFSYAIKGFVPRCWFHEFWHPFRVLGNQ